MAKAALRSDVCPQSERALSEVIPDACPVCGKPLHSRQTVCSAKCRAARSRRKKESALHERDARIRLLLRTAMEALEEARMLLSGATNEASTHQDEPDSV
jgi:predicted nucleic acid-binding Zn ribbon protein